MLTVRDATADDGDVLWAIRRGAVRHVDSGHYTDEQLDAWSRRGDMPDFPYDDPTQYLPVAETGDRIVGFGGADRDEGEVRALYVRPDATADAGTTLLRSMEADLREEGRDEVVLDASLNAVPFYRRFGYAREAFVTHENHGVDLEFVRMHRELGD